MSTSIRDLVLAEDVDSAPVIETIEQPIVPVFTNSAPSLSNSPMAVDSNARLNSSAVHVATSTGDKSSSDPRMESVRTNGFPFSSQIT